VERRSASTTRSESGARREHVPLSRNELLLIFAFWTVMAVLTAVSAMLDPRGRMIQPVLQSAPVAIAFLQSYLWALVTPPIFWLASRVGLDRPHRAARILVLLGAGIVIAMAVDVAVAFARLELLPLPPSRMRRLPLGPFTGISRLWFLDDLIMYSAVLAAGLARVYSLRSRARQEEAARLEAKAAQLAAQLADARLVALRTQLNPHFLFNTLHAIASLVERDPRGVRRMVARLSELMRYSLEGAAEQEVTVRQELDFVSRYLEIMQIRFQGSLDVETRAAPEALDALVPNLVLQPLAENAIKHGIGEAVGAGRIRIDARCEGDDVVLSVWDDGPGLRGRPLQEGIGLRITRERLTALYGDDDAPRLVAREADGGFRTEVRIPFHTRADLRAAAPHVNPGNPWTGNSAS